MVEYSLRNGNYGDVLMIMQKQRVLIEIPYAGEKLHQIGPYIGKMRPALARKLILKYSKEGDWIWDPFSGSGTVPLEARLMLRNVIAGDINPYACVLTQSKLNAPSCINIPIKQLEILKNELRSLKRFRENNIPAWVKSFFHPQTLNEINFISSRLIEKRLFFIMGCFLGILHHQRPGFLSYPASNLVPYLRDKKFPKEVYPEKYEYRDPIPRIEAKINRILAVPPPPLKIKFNVLQNSAVCTYLPAESIDTVITSPPYMNALDYSRDNRLRLWFLGIKDYKSVKSKEIYNISTFYNDMVYVLKNISSCLRDSGFCAIVIGDLKRTNSRTVDVPNLILEIANKEVPELNVIEKWIDELPKKRRSRKEGGATKTETIIIFRRENRR